MERSQPILITGAAGFIGGRLGESLKEKGYTVIGVDELPLFQKRAKLAWPTKTQTVEREALFSWLREAPPLRAVFHLGACADTTCLDSSFLQKWNTEYSQQLWNHCVENRIPFYYASSAATYGDGGKGYRDDESLLNELQPLNPYGLSKHAFDQWTLAQEKAGHVPPYWAGFKFFNVYGYGEFHKGRMASVVLHAFEQIQATGFVRLFKSARKDIAHGQQKRDFVAIEDCVSVLSFALEKKLARGIYNLGTGKARSFLDLANAVFVALGKDPRIVYIDMPGDLLSRYQYFTESRMEKLRAAGYTDPFLSLEEGVSRYVSRLLG